MMKKLTKFKLGVILMTIYVIVLFSFLVGVMRTARDHHLSSIELTEIPIMGTKIPEVGTYEYEIQFCPDEFGRVQDYLDCRREILARLF